MTNTPYHVRIANDAVAMLRQLDAKHRLIIFKLIESLAINPRPPGTVKMEGMTGLYCEQVNSHRLIYKVEDQEVLVLLVK